MLHITHVWSSSTKATAGSRDVKRRSANAPSALRPDLRRRQSRQTLYSVRWILCSLSLWVSCRNVLRPNPSSKVMFEYSCEDVMDAHVHFVGLRSHVMAVDPEFPSSRANHMLKTSMSHTCRTLGWACLRPACQCANTVERDNFGCTRTFLLLTNINILRQFDLFVHHGLNNFRPSEWRVSVDLCRVSSSSLSPLASVRLDIESLLFLVVSCLSRSWWTIYFSHGQSDAPSQYFWHRCNLVDCFRSY